MNLFSLELISLGVQILPPVLAMAIHRKQTKATIPASAPASAPDMAPATIPASAPASAPDMAPASAPDMAPASAPDMAPAGAPASGWQTLLDFGTMAFLLPLFSFAGLLLFVPETIRGISPAEGEALSQISLRWESIALSWVGAVWVGFYYHRGKEILLARFFAPEKKRKKTSKKTGKESTPKEG